MTSEGAQVEAAFRQAHQLAFEVKEPLLPSVWAETHLSLARGLHAKPGPWKNFSFQVEVMDAIADPECGGVTLMWPSQLLGKSSILLAWIGWRIEQGLGGGIVLVMPTLFDAAAWSKTKLASMVRESTLLRELLRPAGRRSGNGIEGAGQNTVQLKVFPGGFLVLVGANSPSGLASHSASLVLCDEVDRFPLEVGQEGDAVSIVSRRAATFADGFVAAVSSPTLKDFSRIEMEYKTTDMRKPFVRCPRCGHEFVMMWKDVRWDKDPLGGHLPETAHMECPGCSEKL
jgi:phage terminase large subunit GpA-like protein